MPRVNIFVPDNLHEDLENIRDTLNVSAICQDALRREVARRQPLTGDVELTEEMIERLQSEKETYERTSQERGFVAGIEWARRARFPELRRWGRYKHASEESLERLTTPPYDAVHWIYENAENLGGSNKDVDRIKQANPELAHLPVVWEYIPGGGEVFWFEFGDHRCFNQGFLQAVKRFWEQVEERI